MSRWLYVATAAVAAFMAGIAFATSGFLLYVGRDEAVAVILLCAGIINSVMAVYWWMQRAQAS